MVEAQAGSASIMQNLEDVEVVGDFSAPIPFGETYLSRFQDIVRGDRVLETELEVLDPRSGTVLSNIFSRLG